MKPRKLSFVAALLALFSTTTASAQVICGESRSAPADDLFVIGSEGWSCDQSWLNYFWAAYHYDLTDWDEWGYYVPCDPAWPLAQAFNANYLVTKVARFADWTPSQIDELDGKDCSTDAAATTYYGPIIDNKTILKIPFFYNNYDPISRASTLVHEARHAAGLGHTASDGTCPRTKSCDARYDGDSPNSVQVDFLMTYAQDCAQPYGLRVEAANRAIQFLNIAFADISNNPWVPPPPSCINLSLYQPAAQWPDPGWASPQNAVDGNTDGNWNSDWNLNSVTHTDITNGPWWWVDLGSLQHIRQINLYNRTDCCTSRLSHYQIAVSADSTDGWDGSWPTIVDNQNLVIADGDGSPYFHQVDVWARWVAVTLAATDYLSLAEVQVLQW